VLAPVSQGVGSGSGSVAGDAEQVGWDSSEAMAPTSVVLRALRVAEMWPLAADCGLPNFGACYRAVLRRVVCTATL
jgi:hypothetical protein